MLSTYQVFEDKDNISKRVESDRRIVYNLGKEPYIRLLGTIPLVWDSLLRQYITFWGF
jgi:hypothetical protein